MNLNKSVIKYCQLMLLNLFIIQISIAQTNINDLSIPVTIKTLSEVQVDRKLVVPAENVSVNTSMLSSEIVGVVESISSEVGQYVSNGDVLLKLDSTDFDLAYKLIQSNLDSNAARIQQAEIRLKRANNLNQKNYIAADDLLARNTDVNVLNAERSSLLVRSKQAKRNIDKTKIKSPFDGIVSARSANVGSYVTPGMPLLKIVQTENAQIYADVPVHLASSLNQTQNIVFETNNKQFPVNLINVSPVIQKGTGTQIARFKFKNIQAPIGSSGELVWIISKGLLPPDLVVSRNGQLGVFTVENNKAVFVVLPNAQEGRPVVTTLERSSKLIIGGRDRLQDGDSVKVK